MSEWISVEERMPSRDSNVLIYLRTNNESWVHVSWFSGDYWVDEDGLPLVYYISHWMPLPEPPK